MEPTSSAPVEQPATPQSPPPADGGSRKKLMIIIGVVVAVVVLAVVLAVVLKNKGADNGKSSKDTTLYYNRPGFDRAKLTANIGDPMAIKITAGKEAQELQSGAVIIPACSLLTKDNINAAGLQLYVNDFGFPFIQNYLDDSGKAPFAADPNNMPSGGDTLGCVYGIQGGETLSVEVNQPFIATDRAVASSIDLLKYVKQADANGFEVYTRTNTIGDKKDYDYLIRKNGATITLKVPGTQQDKADGLLKTIMSNFDDLAQHPKGVSAVSYDTPTFTQSFAKSCDLVDNADMKNLTGVDASPLVQAMWPTAIGVADYSAVSDYKTKSNYIRTQCIRTSNDPAYKTLIGIKKHTLRVTTMTYENTKAASESLKFVMVSKDNDSARKGTGLGDESYVYKTPDEDKQLAIGFRQGRVVVQLIYDFAFQDGMDAASYVNKLSPVADKIAAKLVDFK